MGSVSATASIERVLKAHAAEIRRELLDAYVNGASAGGGSLIKDVALSNRVYEIGVTVTLANGQELLLQGISIEGLAERYPDCEVGY